MGGQLTYDVAVVGAGLLGCFAARALSAHDVRTGVLEAREDVCTGMSKANSAIVYAGYDMKPNTMKARMTVRANRGFASLCEQLGVPFSRCGGLMVAFEPAAFQSLRAKYEQGLRNGVSGMRLLGGDEACEVEPALARSALGALWAQSVGTVMPWDLCIAAAENAAANGAEFRFGARVAAIRRERGGYVLETADGSAVHARAVVNCAGMHADKLAALAGFTRVRIAVSKAEYLVYDSLSSRRLTHVVFYETEGKGKGATAVPCVDGHVIAGGTKGKAKGPDDAAVTADGLRSIFDDVRKVLPALADASVIASFAGVRPSPRWTGQVVRTGASRDACSGGERGGGESIHDFCVEYDPRRPDFVSLVGVKTPGLTCAWELGKHVASLVLGCLGGVRGNEAFDPSRRTSLRPGQVRKRQGEGVAGFGGGLVCTCEGVCEDAVVRAIAQGARNVDGVKRRTGAHMGDCQGAGCEAAIARIIARELDIPLHEVCKNEAGSQVFCPKGGR